MYNITYFALTLECSGSILHALAVDAIHRDIKGETIRAIKSGEKSVINLCMDVAAGNMWRNTIYLISVAVAHKQISIAKFIFKKQQISHPHAMWVIDACMQYKQLEFANWVVHRAYAHNLSQGYDRMLNSWMFCTRDQILMLRIRKKEIYC
jgi:hypothetical protein